MQGNARVAPVDHARVSRPIARLDRWVNVNIVGQSCANFILPVQDGNDICLSGGRDMNGDALYVREGAVFAGS